MIFLIALAVAVIATIKYREQSQSYIVGALIGILFGSGIYTLGSQLFPLEKHVETTRYKLNPIRAAKDDKEYYLLKSSDARGVVNYAIEDNGQTKVRTEVNHVGQIVYDGKKEVTVKEEKEYNFLLQPWQITTHTIQLFHLPKDSLKENAMPERETSQTEATMFDTASPAR
jgi:hypothetical protein